MIPAGQNPVKADWMRLTPTKQVMSNHQGLMKWARETLMRIIDPASTRIIFSVVMVSCRVVYGLFILFMSV